MNAAVSELLREMDEQQRIDTLVARLAAELLAL